MTPLSQEFVDSCPVEEGFRLRGLAMTRIEVFVDAAFAFSVTMLMISFDSIPTSFEEMVFAVKGIPAFLLSVAQLVWIWYTHTIWSKRFGLDGAVAVVLSTALLSVILIYIYPLRVMFEGMFSWFSGGYLPVAFAMQSYDELGLMFVFLGAGFVAFSLIFVLMHRYAASLKSELRLSKYELHETRTIEILWLASAGVGLLVIAVAIVIPPPLVTFSGFGFSLLAIVLPWIRHSRSKSAPAVA